MSEETFQKVIKAFASYKTDKAVTLAAHVVLLDAGLLQDDKNDLDLKEIYRCCKFYEALKSRYG